MAVEARGGHKSPRVHALQTHRGRVAEVGQHIAVWRKVALLERTQRLFVQVFKQRFPIIVKLFRLEEASIGVETLF